MRIMNERLVGMLAIGMLSSTVLLAASALPPSVTVSELWALNEDASLSVSGILVSLRTYESGTEIIVLSDESGDPTVRVVCVPGPGAPPSRSVSMGDLLGVSGDCVFEDGTPVVYCRYGDVRVVSHSDDVVTVGLLSAAWNLFEGDQVVVRGVSMSDGLGGLRLHDAEDGCSILMSLEAGVVPVEGAVMVQGMLVLDRGEMVLVLDVRLLVPED